MGKNFDSRPYCINDFKEWNERKELVLAPYFQRRSVWSDKARSYLIDTILKGLPMPQIYMRHIIDTNTSKSVREIIDGQQRIRTILNFLGDGFKVLKTHDSELGGLYFSELPETVQQEFLKYEITTDLILSSKDEQILNIFARLNTYTVSLNKQELLNARYFGEFKTTVYFLGMKFYKFWTKNKILTMRQILRMEEAEFASELIIAMIDGIQPKTVIESYYKKYDDNFSMKSSIIERFEKCMDILGEIFQDTLSDSNLSGKPQFYSVFCVIYDLMYGLKNSPIDKRIKITSNDYPKIRAAIDDIDRILDSETKWGSTEEFEKYKSFIEAFKRHTTNKPERLSRHKIIADLILKKLER